VLAKGLDAINAVKWPIRFLIVVVGLSMLVAASYGIFAALRFVFSHIS
jgi:hypothetical protein